MGVCVSGAGRYAIWLLSLVEERSDSVLGVLGCVVMVNLSKSRHGTCSMLEAPEREMPWINKGIKKFYNI